MIRLPTPAGLLLAVGLGWAARHTGAQAVRRWRPGVGRVLRSGPLQVRVHGDSDDGTVVLLLHGMVASGASFGAAYDRLTPLVVPDLLGFGGSRGDYRASAADQLDALDAAMAELGLSSNPVVVAGHSMGGALGMRWAARHPARVRAVVTFGAPLYVDHVEADSRVAGMGWLVAYLAGDGPRPRAACDWMCAHRRLAGWLAVAGLPALPIAVARASVEHTWRSYSTAYEGVIRPRAGSRRLSGSSTAACRSCSPPGMSIRCRCPDEPLPSPAGTRACERSRIRALTTVFR